MDSSVHQLDLNSLPKWAGLLNRFRVLWVSANSDSGDWLTTALSQDRACKVELVHATSHAQGLQLLREESFDLILVQHVENVLDGPEFVAAFRGGAHEEPLIVMGTEPATTLQPICTEAGADDYLCMQHCSTRGLLWSMSRACQRWELQRENRRLLQNDAQRNQSEQLEAARLLSEQRAMIQSFDPAPRSITLTSRMKGTIPRVSTKPDKLSPTIVESYQGLLRAYVIMGSGTLNREMRELSTSLIEAHASAQQLMLLHLETVESLLQGQGKRSSRHILMRADLLILEILMDLADGYRRNEG
jgi:DNA-binding response OmpR family regulator